MLLTTVVHGPKKQTLADAVPELLESFKGLEAYAFTSLILIRGWGIGYRLALLLLALLPFLICLSGSIWEITTYYRRSSPILHDIADTLILVPFGVLQSLLLLILSFLTFIQTGNGQLAYVLPGRSIHPA